MKIDCHVYHERFDERKEKGKTRKLEIDDKKRVSSV